jgi:hypothetical protein
MGLVERPGSCGRRWMGDINTIYCDYATTRDSRVLVLDLLSLIVYHF